MTIPPHEIILKTDDEGNLIATVEGIKGPGCTDVSKWLDSLGNVTDHKKRTSYYATAESSVKDALAQGGCW